MYSAEVLSQLRSLNWLTQELRRLPAGSLEAGRIRDQMAAVRARLPLAMLDYHDRLATKGRASAAEVHGLSCGACHLRLPQGLLGELAVPGRFSVCPHCGVFLWRGEVPAPTPPKRVGAKAAPR